MEAREKVIITQNQVEGEIELIEIAAKIWTKRRFIIKTILIFIAIGIFIAIFSPNEYTATSTMVPQTGDKKAGGSLSGLAAMAGISLGSMSSGEVLSPNVYPIIISNVNFKKELIYSKYHFIDIKEPISLYDYYTDKRYVKFNLISSIKKFTIGLPGVIIKAIKGKSFGKQVSDTCSIQSLTKEEMKVIKILNENIMLDINDKQGFIRLTTKMPEPLAAAELTQKVQELLQKYITEFKVEKVSSNLAFVEKSFEEAKKNFEQKQEELANFRDSNKNLSSSIAKTQEEKLSSEYNLLLGIYTELAKQKEQAKISVTETTPILTVIEPVVVPMEKSKPKRFTILIVFTLFGCVTGAGIVLITPFIKESYQKIKS